MPDANLCVCVYVCVCVQDLPSLPSLRLLSVRNPRFDERCFEGQFQRLMRRTPALQSLCLGPFSSYIPVGMLVNLPAQVQHVDIDM